MSNADRERWDELHGKAGGDGEPCTFLREVFAAYDWLLRPGKALDVACGRGRNAIFLAERGWTVDALDISAVALARVENLARARNLSVNARQADLDNAELPPAAYDLVLTLNYLQRGFMAQLKQTVRIGGYAIFETFLVDQAAAGQPKNPDYLLRHNELLDAFREFRVLWYREGKFADGKEAAFRAGIFAQRIK